MSEKTLSRIEKTLEKLAARQDEICAELGRVAERVDGLAPAEGAPRRKLLRFLDEFRAGEALGEASLGAWLSVATTACLKGGLRTIQMREGFHARLLGQRIRELGGTPRHEIPEAIRDAVMRDAADPGKADTEKLLAFVQRFPDIDKALEPIHAQADALDDDPETQSLLRTIAQDERSTLEFLKAACEQLHA